MADKQIKQLSEEDNPVSGDWFVMQRGSDDETVKVDAEAVMPFSDGDSAYVATSQTTTSTSYADLATAGPAVTVTIGQSGMAIVGLYCGCNNSGGNNSTMGFVASGANTIAASDIYCVSHNGSGQDNHSGVHLLTGLTPGSTVFTAKYKVSAGTGTFLDRRIFVIPL